MADNTTQHSNFSKTCTTQTFQGVIHDSVSPDVARCPVNKKQNKIKFAMKGNHERFCSTFQLYASSERNM